MVKLFKLSLKFLLSRQKDVMKALGSVVDNAEHFIDCCIVGRVSVCVLCVLQ
jgi:hypothetical protein